MDLRITTATGRSVGPIDHHGNGIRDPVGSSGWAHRTPERAHPTLA
jgi:hypothetical protein